MSATRRTTDPWLAAAGLLLALGLSLELRAGHFLWGFGTLLTVTVLAWLLAIALDLRQPELDRALRLGPPGACAVVLAVNGLGRVTPWAALVVVVLALLSPRCRAVIVRGTRWLVIGDIADALPDRPSAGVLEASRRRHPSARPVLPAPASVSTSALPRAWADSYFALRSSFGQQELRDIVELRGRYLDQMERSDPDGFAAWLEAGADPARSFHPRPAGPAGT